MEAFMKKIFVFFYIYLATFMFFAGLKAQNVLVLSQKHYPAKNTREAFKKEDKLIKRNKGTAKEGNTNTYNQINSPGKKYNDQDSKK
jgi:hypothetical protein